MKKNKTTKNDIVDQIYKEFKESGNSAYERQKILEVMDKVLDQIKESLERGETIELRGFGTFMPKLRKGREIVINPKTGERVNKVEPHYVAVFKAGQSLKENLSKLQVIDEE